MTQSAKKMVTYFSPLIPKTFRSNTSLMPKPLRWSTTFMTLIWSGYGTAGTAYTFNVKA